MIAINRNIYQPPDITFYDRCPVCEVVPCSCDCFSSAEWTIDFGSYTVLSFPDPED